MQPLGALHGQIPAAQRIVPAVYSGLWTGDTDWASADVTQALEDYKTLLSCSNTDRSGLDWPDAAKYVTDGQAAYTVMGDWTAGAFKEQGLVDGKDYTWFAVPGQEGVFDFLADSFTLPVGAPNEGGAKAWLTDITSAVGQFGGSEDVAQFQEALVAAAEGNAG